MTQLRRFSKAIVGFIAPGAVYVLVQGPPDSSGDWWLIACTCIATAAGVAVTGPRGGRVDP